MQKIIEIQASPKLKKVLRVAAYARVSKASEWSHHSISQQISEYNKKIQNHDGWVFAGIYADEAITGTKDTRPEFQRLIVDVRNNKIDLILVKSVARFARNTMTLLETVKEFKEHNCDVYFENENLHSISPEGEMILTLMASVAEEESRQNSDNIKWKIKKDFLDGKLYGGGSCCGYKLENRKYKVVPEEAKLVKRIYELYLEGKGLVTICDILDKEGIKPSKGGDKWNKGSIRYILDNKSYIGDLLLQKTYVDNHLTKERRINKGELPMYYVEDDHEAIIDKELFNKVQNLRKEKIETYKKKTPDKVYPFTGILECGHCGKSYRHKLGPYNNYWICSTYFRYGKNACPSKQIQESQLYKAINEWLGIDEFDEDLFKKKVSKIIVLDNNLLELHLTNGTKEIIKWNDANRSDGWTKEKREKASIQARERERKRGLKGKWEK